MIFPFFQSFMKKIWLLSVIWNLPNTRSNYAKVKWDNTKVFIDYFSVDRNQYSTIHTEKGKIIVVLLFYMFSWVKLLGLITVVCEMKPKRNQQNKTNQTN